MAPAIVHFLVGASILLLIATPFAFRYDLSSWWPLWLVAFGGLWGLIPDAHHIAPAYQPELRTFHDSRWADLFAFHYALDRPFVRARYTESIFASVVLFLGAVSAFTLASYAGTRLDAAAVNAPRPDLPASTIVISLSTLAVGVVLGGLLYATIG